MNVKMILPALTEAKTPLYRPVKYSLFPPLGLATLAAYFSPSDHIDLQDQHVETLTLDDNPELVIIQVYITNAYRAYAIADHYRKKGAYVLLGGLHVTSLPDEAALHADTIFLGPAEQTFPQFLKDYKAKVPEKVYFSQERYLHTTPPPRRDLIKRHLYLVPNSLIVSRGCPHHCSFCYKDSFFKGGSPFYTRHVDEALREIETLPGRHLYFLDDHLLGNPHFAGELFEGMKGMNRLFQGAATVASILNGDCIEKAAKAGLKSLFVGFETFSAENLKSSNKLQNINRDYTLAVNRLHSLGIMINGSFVFGLDGDTSDVFARTVEWGLTHALTTATYHILTPYPGTSLYSQMEREHRIVSRNWQQYDTRSVVYTPARLSPDELKRGYDWAYKEFYRWPNIFKASLNHPSLPQTIKHMAYTAGWKKFEPLWNLLIQARGLGGALPFLEALLSSDKKRNRGVTNAALSATAITE